MIDKESAKKEFMKFFYKRFMNTPESYITWKIDHSAIDINYRTPLARIAARIYDEQIIIFSNHKTEYAKQYSEISEDIFTHIDEILQDSVDRF